MKKKTLIYHKGQYRTDREMKKYFPEDYQKPCCFTKVVRVETIGDKLLKIYDRFADPVLLMAIVGMIVWVLVR